MRREKKRREYNGLTKLRKQEIEAYEKAGSAKRAVESEATTTDRT